MNSTQTPAIDTRGAFLVVSFGATVIAWGCPMADAIEISRYFAIGVRCGADTASILSSIAAHSPRLAVWLAS